MRPGRHFSKAGGMMATLGSVINGFHVSYLDGSCIVIVERRKVRLEDFPQMLYDAYQLLLSFPRSKFATFWGSTAEHSVVNGEGFISVSTTGVSPADYGYHIQGLKKGARMMKKIFDRVP